MGAKPCLQTRLRRTKTSDLSYLLETNLGKEEAKSSQMEEHEASKRRKGAFTGVTNLLRTLSVCTSKSLSQPIFVHLLVLEFSVDNSFRIDAPVWKDHLVEN